MFTVNTPSTNHNTTNDTIKAHLQARLSEIINADLSPLTSIIHPSYILTSTLWLGEVGRNILCVCVRCCGGWCAVTVRQISSHVHSVQWKSLINFHFTSQSISPRSTHINKHAAEKVRWLARSRSCTAAGKSSSDYCSSRFDFKKHSKEKS